MGIEIQCVIKLYSADALECGDKINIQLISSNSATNELNFVVIYNNYVIP